MHFSWLCITGEGKRSWPTRVDLLRRFSTRNFQKRKLWSVIISLQRWPWPCSTIVVVAIVQLVVLVVAANRIVTSVVRGCDFIIILVFAVIIAGSPVLNQHTDLMGQTHMARLGSILEGQLQLHNSKTNKIATLVHIISSNSWKLNAFRNSSLYCEMLW